MGLSESRVDKDFEGSLSEFTDVVADSARVKITLHLRLGLLVHVSELDTSLVISDIEDLNSDRDILGTTVVTELGLKLKFQTGSRDGVLDVVRLKVIHKEFKDVQGITRREELGLGVHASWAVLFDIERLPYLLRSLLALLTIIIKCFGSSLDLSLGMDIVLMLFLLSPFSLGLSIN